MRNIVFIPNIDLGNGRSDKYSYCINSWKYWCDKNDCELLLLEDLLLPVEQMRITWQRYYVFDVLDNSNIDYNQVLVVDADTIVHPECPNFFNETDGKYAAVMNDGDYEWVNRAINGYSKLFFDKEFFIPTFKFFQTGFVIINKKHKDFFDKVFDFYDKNKEEIIRSYDVLLTGSDISIMNCLRKEFGVELNLLPKEFGIMDMARKNLFYLTKNCWWKDDLTNLYNSGWVYQFNAIPQNELGRDRTYWMKRIYDELYSG